MVHLSGKCIFVFCKRNILLNHFDWLVLAEAQEKLKKYREDNERKSKEVLDLWESSVKHKIKQLGNDRK